MATMTIEAIGIQVRQSDLSRIKTLRAQVESAKAELGDLEATVEAQLADGFAVEPGLLTAKVETFERRSVSWRGVVERIKGVGYAENILKHTKPTVHARLVVEAA